MNIKKETIEKFRIQVDSLVMEKKFQEALEIASKYPLGVGHEKSYVICKSRLLDTYEIGSADLDSISCVIKPNPHYKNANMYLFLEDEVKLKFKVKSRGIKIK